MGASMLTPAVAVQSTSLATALDAFRRGDFERVLALVEAGTQSPEAILLRARTLLKMHRPDDVISELGPAIEHLQEVDAKCTARMFFGAAMARLHLSHGRKLLADLADDAERLDARPSVRAEIAYFRALTAWSARDFADAESFALVAERARLDLLSVRAKHLRGFIAVSSAKYSVALMIFHQAQAAYAKCQEIDVDLATIILEQIAGLEQTLRSARVPGTHRDPAGRRIPGTSFGPALRTVTRLELSYQDAWLFANDGDRFCAMRKMRDAVAFAPTDAWRVWALAGQASIAIAFGEIGMAQIIVDDAWPLAKAVDWSATKEEERFGLHELAEVTANLRLPIAPEILARYGSVVAPIHNVNTLHNQKADPRLAGWEAYVRGLVERSQGNDAAALRHLRESVSLFNSCGYRWREALALLELDATPGSSLSEGPSALEQAAQIIGKHFPKSFLWLRLGAWARAYTDPVVSKLTPAQRDVLRRLLEGRRPGEIAKSTGRTYDTVLTHIKPLHLGLKTHTLHQIVAECNRRGIAAPGMPIQVSGAIAQ
jgi:DNA-binding CsgD family transcriptional regulator